MNKHTPGKWYTGNSVFGDFGVFTDADIHPNMICSVKKSIDDARLIAAAPDMLEALISIYKEFKDDDMKQFSVKCWRIIIERATGMTIDEILQEG